MPVVDPLARPRPLRIDRHLPDAGYVNAHTLDIDLPPDEVWAALPRVIDEGEMGVVLTTLFRASDLMRGDLRFRRPPPRRPIELREGEDVGSFMGPYDPGVFVIADVDEGREVVVHAEHRYAEGVFGVALEPLDDHRSRAWSVTRAAFTGTVPSRIYRLAVTALRGPIVDAALRKLKTGAEAQPRP